MRADPDLCFLERVGMPDVMALSAEQSGSEVPADANDRQEHSFVFISNLLPSTPN